MTLVGRIKQPWTLETVVGVFHVISEVHTKYYATPTLSYTTWCGRDLAVIEVPKKHRSDHAPTCIRCMSKSLPDIP